MDSPAPIYAAIAAAIVVLAAARARLDRRRGARRVYDFLGGVETAAILLLLSGLMILGGLQIVLRNVAHTGLLWADPLMRHIVLWLGCLGATLATARVRHINIDVFSRLLSGWPLAVRDAVVHGATAVMAFVLGVAALRLVVDERAFGDVVFSGLPTWVAQVILPVAFFLIAYRSIVNLLLRRRPKPVEEGD